MRASFFLACVAAVAVLSVKAQWPQPAPQYGAGRYILIAQLNGQQPDNGDYINLGEVTAYDCAGNRITPRGAQMSSTWSRSFPATNCIDNNPNTFCHTRQGGGHQWLQIDLGSSRQISRIVVANRHNCCRDRILHYDIAIFTGANGVGQVSETMPFSTTATSYNFQLTSNPYAGGGCRSGVTPTTLASVANQVSTVVSTVAVIQGQVTAIPAAQLQLLQSELSNLNTATLSTLSNEITTLSQTVAADTSAGMGNLVQNIASVAAVASGVSTTVAQTVQPMINSVSTATSTASSTAMSTATSHNSLRTAITGAAAADNSGASDGTTPVSPMITSDGTVINVMSGGCQTMDLCDSSAFAVNLRQALQAL